MTMRYFKLSDDVTIPGRWHLDDPVDQKGKEVDPWQFSDGKPVSIQGPLKIPIMQQGKALDYSTTPLGPIPIVHAKVAELFSTLAPNDMQLIPTKIPRRREQYYLVNTLRAIKCIDDARCKEVSYWTPEHGQPEKVGTYHGVIGMRIDPSRVGDAHIFRPWGWEVTLIVSEDIKRGLERLGATGPRFTEV